MIAQKNPFLTFSRHGIYMVCAFGLMFVQHILSGIYFDTTFSEFGCVENLQVVLLLLCLILFLIGVKINIKISPLTFLISAFVLLCIFREMDNFFDKTIPFFKWKIGFIFLAMAIINAIKHIRQFKENLILFSIMPSYYLMLGASFIILPCAQLIGHKPFLDNILVKGSDLGAIKELIEESAETLGYFILLCAAIEWLINLQSLKNLDNEK